LTLKSGNRLIAVQLALACLVVLSIVVGDRVGGAGQVAMFVVGAVGVCGLIYTLGLRRASFFASREYRRANTPKSTSTESDPTND